MVWRDLRSEARQTLDDVLGTNRRARLAMKCYGVYLVVVMVHATGLAEESLAASLDRYILDKS